MSADGTWNITIETQMGAQNATLVLSTSGTELSGKMESPQGTIDLTDGKVEGETLSWKASLTQPMPITLECTAKVEGDSISGEAQLGSFGSAPFSGTRA